MPISPSVFSPHRAASAAPSADNRYKQLAEIMSRPDNLYAMIPGRAVAPTKSSLSLGEIRKLGEDVAAAHPLKGGVRKIGYQYVVGFRCPDGQAAKMLERGMALAVFRWDGYFGSAVTFTTQAPGRTTMSRAWVPTSDPILGSMLAGDRLVVIPFYRGQPVSVITSEPFHPLVREALDRITNRNDEEHRRPGPLVAEDARLSFWETFHLSPIWNALLSKQDRLQIGWAKRYLTSLRYLVGVVRLGLEPVPELDPADPSFLERRAAFKVLDDALWDRIGIPFLNVLHGRMSPVELVRVARYTDCMDMLIGHEDSPNPFEINRQYLGELTQTAAIAEEQSCEGLQAVFSDNSPNGLILKPVPIPTEGLTDEQADLYWKNVPSGHAVGVAHLVAGGLIPADLNAIGDEIRSIRLGCTPAEASEAIRSLTDEANLLNRWTIPWGARVQVRIGPFVEIDFYPQDNEIAILLRTADGGYRWGAFNLRKEAWNLIHVFRNEHETLFYEETDKEQSDEIELAIQLLLVSIVRDFVVLEDRTAGFAVVHATRTASSRPLDANAPRIIYIPRVRYITEPDVAQMNADLEASERVPHQVRAHLRRSDHASHFQAVLAARYGFILSTGYTFVRPHYRGGLPPEREVIYRSRSAMRSLYGAAPEIVGTATSQWFLFEQDVAAVMARMGFEVDHVAASRTGDEGVDVFAEHSKSGEAWAIQCKCYAPARKIGPAVVRELIGALATYPTGTRGMIVTTSSFSSGAVALAREFNIVLNGLRANPATGETDFSSF